MRWRFLIWVPREAARHHKTATPKVVATPVETLKTEDITARMIAGCEYQCDVVRLSRSRSVTPAAMIEMIEIARSPTGIQGITVR
jgi:hypothetical protein